MEFLSALTAGSVFALACNLDTVLASVGQGARGIPLGPRELFTAAGAALEESGITGLEDELIFIINHIIDMLVENKPLLNFISKNLVMGALRSALLTGESSDREFYDKFLQLVEQDAYSYADVDVMLFTIVELSGSAGYNSILYNEPLPIETYKPFLYRSVRLIIQSHRAG